MNNQNDNLIMTLAKVIIAAAWADGTITEDEQVCLKDLVFRVPEVSAQQWDELDIYIDSPVSAAERAQLIERLASQTRSEDERQLALRTLDELVAADGDVSDAERAVVSEVKRALESADVGLWGSFSRLLIGRRAVNVATAPGREADLDDFRNNRVYYEVQRQMREQGITWDVSDAELRRLSLAGALMALVAEVSDDVSDEEREAMVAALERAWTLPAESARFVVAVATSGSTPLDVYRLTRQFSEVYTLDESRQFLHALFAVATADGKASYDEIEQIRLISQGLKLTNQEFIDAKMQWPGARYSA